MAIRSAPHLRSIRQASDRSATSRRAVAGGVAQTSRRFPVPGCWRCHSRGRRPVSWGRESSIKDLMMRVFVAGATGAIGKQLVPRLVAAGHEVHGMTHNESRQAMLYELGAVPVVADVLDPDQVAEAVGTAEPDVIVHQATAFGAVDKIRPRHADRDFALTRRLRAEGTDHLLSAGQAVGIRRFVAQGNFASYARTGTALKSEEDPFDPSPPREVRESWAAMRHLEEAVLGAPWTEGIVLRYGGVFGPGTSIAAVEHGSRGIYNVVDDDPAPVAEWVPALARTLGAKKPRRVPRFVVRLLAGEMGVAMMTELRGASNAKAKRELGWRPAHPSWREGFARAHPRRREEVAI